VKSRFGTVQPAPWVDLSRPRQAETAHFETFDMAAQIVENWQGRHKKQTNNRWQKQNMQKRIPCPFPEKIVHAGEFVVLEPLSGGHMDDLWAAASQSDRSFDHLRYGPFATKASLQQVVEDLSSRDYQPFWAVRDLETGRVNGWLSLCDVYPQDGAIEIGSIWFSPLMQRSRGSTEAIFLLMRYAMDDLGYQRLVWRCSARNTASVGAAQRYGFVPEGMWRQAILIKGNHLDVAWFSILADEWSARRRAIEAWLRKENFSADGVALTRLRRNTESGVLSGNDVVA